jgi:hypothetical protein
MFGGCYSPHTGTDNMQPPAESRTLSSYGRGNDPHGGRDGNADDVTAGSYAAGKAKPACAPDLELSAIVRRTE